MWYFRSPEVVFGEDALEHLELLQGEKAIIVTDPMMEKLGFVATVAGYLDDAGFEYQVYTDVEPEPSLETITKGAAAMEAYQPDWIIALGGGSAMDAAKGMWTLYENPDITPEEISPFTPLVYRQKARLVAIPTTSGTGSEVTYFTVLTDLSDGRKIGTAHPEMIPDVAIVDPLLAQKMPPRLTADTGLDVLTHAIEGYTSAMFNDFTDGISLKAIELVFDYLPRVYADGDDMEAREKMHNAATLGGLSFGNSQVALAHSLGHSFGATFHIPHGRAVALFLPYTIQFMAFNDPEARYHDISRWLSLPADTPEIGVISLVEAIRELYGKVDQPGTIAQILQGDRATFDAKLDDMVAKTEMDTVVAMGTRVPDSTEIRKLFEYAYTGDDIDF